MRAGQPLFRIDPGPYAAAYQSAEASLARAEANRAQATALAERYKPLVEANAISKQDYANAVAAQKQSEADVLAGKAAVQTAKINLDYALVTAPIGGRIFFCEQDNWPAPCIETAFLCALEVEPAVRRVLG